ncbi:hypothetical protein RHA1_ro09127 (plasmid) [Rhodococcus jostii RHA1]|uniref:Uncharacterized protein n=1 Tax=Rhodococcus jostii (strain RHA1) TaxID=101510 RepID=Q0RX16_RHOJR|nr:hypothetical protein RHA1_ro09127 [Rhodococcus jostii RHA1]
MVLPLIAHPTTRTQLRAGSRACTPKDRSVLLSSHSRPMSPAVPDRRSVRTSTVDGGSCRGTVLHRCRRRCAKTSMSSTLTGGRRVWRCSAKDHFLHAPSKCCRGMDNTMLFHNGKRTSSSLTSLRINVKTGPYCSRRTWWRWSRRWT